MYNRAVMKRIKGLAPIHWRTPSRSLVKMCTNSLIEQVATNSQHRPAIIVSIFLMILIFNCIVKMICNWQIKSTPDGNYISFVVIFGNVLHVLTAVIVS